MLLASTVLYLFGVAGGSSGLTLSLDQAPWADIFAGLFFIGVGAYALRNALQRGGEFHIEGMRDPITHDGRFMFFFAAAVFVALTGLGIVMTAVGAYRVFLWITR